MSLALPFTEDQRDCLQEIINVAMGASGESLAAFAEVFVKLPIPLISYINADELHKALSAVDGGEKISVIAQRFVTATIEGYALVAITESSFNDLSEFTDHAVNNDQVAVELLNSLCHTICSTCLNRLAEMKGETIEIVEPTKLVALHQPLRDLKFDELANWGSMVTAEINYHLEDHPFNCDMVLLFPESSVGGLKKQLDALLED